MVTTHGMSKDRMDRVTAMVRNEIPENAYDPRVQPYDETVLAPFDTGGS